MRDCTDATLTIAIGILSQVSSNATSFLLRIEAWHVRVFYCAHLLSEH